MRSIACGARSLKRLGWRWRRKCVAGRRTRGSHRNVADTTARLGALRTLLPHFAVSPVVPDVSVSGVAFTDTDISALNVIGGDVTWTAPGDTSNVEHYAGSGGRGCLTR